MTSVEPESLPRGVGGDAGAQGRLSQWHSRGAAGQSKVRGPITSSLLERMMGRRSFLYLGR